MSKRISLPKRLREKIKAKYGGNCGYCGVKPDRLQIDHVVPVEFGGTNEELNLMPVCFQCNNYKCTHGLETFRETIHRQVAMARKYSINFRNAERFGLIQEIKIDSIVFHFEKDRCEFHE